MLHVPYFFPAFFLANDFFAVFLPTAAFLVGAFFFAFADFFAATFFGAAFLGAAFFPFTAALTATSPLLKKFARSPRGCALARMLLDWDTVGAIAPAVSRFNLCSVQ